MRKLWTPGLDKVELTLKLDRPYMVDAILVVGGYSTWMSNYKVYIGMDPDFNNNKQCDLNFDVIKSWIDGGAPNRPWMNNWPNGDEIFCNTYGQYVSFTMKKRDGMNRPCTLCEFGVIADLDSAYAEATFVQEWNFP